MRTLDEPWAEKESQVRYEETRWWKKQGKCVTNSPEGESTPLSCSICYWGDVLWHPSWLRHPPAGGSIAALWCIHLEFSHREENENKTDASRRWQESSQIHVIYSAVIKLEGWDGAWKMFLKFGTERCVFPQLLVVKGESGSQDKEI